MNRSVLGAGLGILAVVIVGALVFANSKDKDEATAPPATSQVESTNSDNNSTGTTQNETGPQPSGQSSTQAQTASVQIKDFAYSPSTLTVKKGTKVTWTNQDSMQHDVTPDDESSNFAGSQLLSKGESYSYTFNTAGTYSYHCTPHTYMKATVVVTD